MRSDRVFEALHTLRNRYMLCQLASKATRKFHRPNTRIQETMNQVFDKIADAERHGHPERTRKLCRSTTAGCLSSSAVCPHGGKTIPRENPSRKIQP